MKLRLRGTVYHIDDPRNRRLRGSLGTSNGAAAKQLLSKVEVASAAGPLSPLWNELALRLPKKTFHRIATFYGVEPLVLDHSWDELLCEYSRNAEFRIAAGKFSSRTKERYDRVAGRLTEFLKNEGVSQLRAITEPVLERFELKQRNEVAKDPCFRSGSSVDSGMNALHAIFQFGVNRKMIASNPVRFRKLLIGADNGDPFDPDELGLLYHHADKDLLAYLVFRWTGLRISDVVTLTFEEIARRSEEINRIALKNKKPLNVPIRAELFALIEAERLRRNAGPSDCVLINHYTGEPFTINSLYRHMVKLGARAGVAHVHPHRFRHTFIVDLLVKGLSLYEVAQLVGDTEETIRRHYTKFVKAFRDKARLAIDGPGGLGDGGPETGVEAVAVDQRPVIEWPTTGPTALSPEVQSQPRGTGSCDGDGQLPTASFDRKTLNTRTNSRKGRYRVAESQQSLWPSDAGEECPPASQPPDEVKRTVANN